tara:strand:- start:389 stop:583 length:195 start_codon:yes stop_codon:yes gene_type:complete
MWEVWEWDGQYVQGKLLKKYESRESAMKYAKKTIQYKKATRLKKNEIFLEDENHMPIGVLIRRG